MANHIKLEKLIENCLRVRRLELNNWKEMMELKMRRTEKSDMIEFIDLYKSIKEIRNERELFALCEKFLRESKLSCLNNRIKLLLFLQKEGVIPNDAAYTHALYRVLGFFEYLMPDIKKQKQ
jgi:midasin (ATPase involved in ribosome maturation)